MYRAKPNRLWYLLGLFLCAAGLTAGALWDLPLAHALYAPERFAAVFMEAFGFYPAYLPAVFLLACLARDGKRPLWLRVLCGVGTALGAAGLSFYSYHELGKHQIAPYALPLIAAVWIVLLVCGLWGLARVGRATLRRLQFVCVWGVCFLACNLVVTNLFKLIWNRSRFDDMLAADKLDAFTAWLHPFGNGGSSFPSGHTAAACGIFVLVLLCDVFASWARRRTLVWAACWMYVGGMAVCRMVSGRHFLSDTVAAAFLMTCVFLLLSHSAPYRRGALALNEADASAGRTAPSEPDGNGATF